MLKSGLVSISFRGLSCEEIIALCVENGLQGIEWGGDVHVPPGDMQRARQVKRLTKEAGLQVFSYGSYYKVGTYKENWKKEFEPVLQAAKALGAPLVRLWAGQKGSADTSARERSELVVQMKELSAMAKAYQMELAFECHSNTLTDRKESFGKLIEEIGCDNVKMNWQPNQEYDFSYNEHALKEALPHLRHIHVFQWPSPGVRESLEKGQKEWTRYFSLIAGAEGIHPCMLEFMPDDKPESLRKEAAILHNWIRQFDGDFSD